MTVRQLIRELQDCDQDAEVYFGYDYGDYWHTEVFESVGTLRSDTLAPHARTDKHIIARSANPEDESEEFDAVLLTVD